MHVYRPTQRGESIAQNSGLSKLADKLATAEEIQEFLLFDITRLDLSNIRLLPPDQDIVENNAVLVANRYSRGFEEMRTLSRGLNIDPKTDHWRYFKGNDQHTLFPHQRTMDFLPAIRQDRFVVSGVVGVLLKGYRSQCRLLARSRFAEYGFSNFMESCAFVGAYVVARIMDEEERRLHTKEPTFEISGKDTSQIITIGATFHGDFRIGLTRTLKDDIISPANSIVDFAPRDSLWVGGYHSVEPNILASIITNEYSTHGLAAARKLVSELTEVLSDLALEDGTLNNHKGTYADSGDDDASYPLTYLSVLLKNPGQTPRMMRDDKLYSEPYLPQSPFMFEIKSIENGIRFQGRHEDNAEPDLGIDVPRDSYPDLFRALVLQQAQLGFGRTSPNQLDRVLDYATKMLNSHS